jgi:hypothetical protein
MRRAIAGATAAIMLTFAVGLTGAALASTTKKRHVTFTFLGAPVSSNENVYDVRGSGFRGAAVQIVKVNKTATAGTSIAAAPSGALVPGSGSVGGRGYGQWVAAAWRWRVALPDVTTNKTSCLTAGQHGPVWFLSGSEFKASSITRTCAIPAGRYIIIFAPSVDCSTVEKAPFHATTDAGLQRCARAWWRGHQGEESVTLDGVSLRPVGYVGGTGAFQFRMPARNNWIHARGHTRGRMAVYGFAAILRPLSPGSHTLVLAEAYKHSTFYSKTTYQLTIG